MRVRQGSKSVLGEINLAGYRSQNTKQKRSITKYISLLLSLKGLDASQACKASILCRARTLCTQPNKSVSFARITKHISLLLFHKGKYNIILNV